MVEPMTDRMAAMATDNDPGVLAREIRDQIRALGLLQQDLSPSAAAVQIACARHQMLRAADYLESLSAPVGDEEKVLWSTLNDELRLANLDLTTRELREPTLYNAIKAAMREYARRLRAPVGKTAKPWCEHCGKETPVECWECASRLNRAPVGVTVGEPALTGLEVVKVAHTPGPWVIVGPPTRISIAVGNRELDEVTAIPRGKNKDANAALIAAAPDLAEVVIGFVTRAEEAAEEHPEMRDTPEWALVEKGRAALSKALLQANGVSGSPSSPIQTSELEEAGNGLVLVPRTPTPEMLAAALPLADAAIGTGIDEMRLAELALGLLEKRPMTNEAHQMGLQAAITMICDYRAMIAAAGNGMGLR